MFFERVWNLNYRQYNSPFATPPRVYGNKKKNKLKFYFKINICCPS